MKQFYLLQNANSAVSIVLYFGSIIVAVLLTAIITTIIVGRKRAGK